MITADGPFLMLAQLRHVDRSVGRHIRSTTPPSTPAIVIDNQCGEPDDQRMRRALLWAFCGFGALVIGFATPRAAVQPASGWQSVETIRRDEYFGSVQLVADVGGTAVAAWEGGNGGVYGLFRNPAATWTSGRLLVPGPAPRRAVHGFALAGDKHGRAVLLVASKRLTARVADLGGRRWSAPRVLEQKPRGRPIVAVDGTGQATAVWLRGGKKPGWLSARGSLRTGQWSKPVVTASATTSEPQLVLDRSGGAYVLSVRCLETRRARCGLGRPLQNPELRRYRMELRHRGAGGRWGPVVARSVQFLHLLGTRTQRALIADQDGGVTVVWVDSAKTVEASTLRPGTRTWSRPVQLVAPRRGDFGAGPAWPTEGMLRSSTNVAGDAIVTWIAPTHNAVEVGAAIRVAGTSEWSPLRVPSELERSSCCPSYDLAIADDRTVFLAADLDIRGERRRIVAGVRSPGADWSLNDLSLGEFERALVVTEPSRSAFAVWVRDSGRRDVLEAARWLSTQPPNPQAGSSLR